LLDGAGFEEVDWLAISEGVAEGGDASVRVDLQEPWLLLRVLRDVNFVNNVRDSSEIAALAGRNRFYVWMRTDIPKLFQCYGYLDAVWGLGRVQVDVGALRSHGEGLRSSRL
jgi:hypothetical protein